MTTGWWPIEVSQPRSRAAAGDPFRRGLDGVPDAGERVPPVNAVPPCRHRRGDRRRALGGHVAKAEDAVPVDHGSAMVEPDPVDVVRRHHPAGTAEPRYVGARGAELLGAALEPLLQLGPEVSTHRALPSGRGNWIVDGSRMAAHREQRETAARIPRCRLSPGRYPIPTRRTTFAARGMRWRCPACTCGSV